MSAPEIAPSAEQARLVAMGRRHRAALVAEARRMGLLGDDVDAAVGLLGVTALLLASENNGSFVFGAGEAIGRALAQLVNPGDAGRGVKTLNDGIQQGLNDARQAFEPRGRA